MECTRRVAPNKLNHCSEVCRKKDNRYAYKQRQKAKKNNEPIVDQSLHTQVKEQKPRFVIGKTVMKKSHQTRFDTVVSVAEKR